MRRESAIIPILDAVQRQRGELLVSLLPDRSNGPIPPLLVVEEDEREPGQPRVQLLEGWEYRYEFRMESTAEQPLTTDRPEFFSPDRKESRSGRIKTGLYVGTVPTTIYCDNVQLGSAEFEVRTSKLDYLRHYRWMLRDLAEVMTELVMQSFAVSQRRFQAELPKDPATLYERFCIMKSLLEQERYQAAVRQVIARPYVSWSEDVEIRPAALGTGSGSDAQRALLRGGARIPWPSSTVPGLETIPDRIGVRRNEATVDNVPNRFVKYALMQWRQTVAEIHDALSSLKRTYPVKRGMAETISVLDQLDAVLAEELFREVGTITHFPASNQVLQRRAGYRDLFHAYALLELAAQLSWSGGEDVYSAGQRNVAKLYEYWVFFSLVRIVSDIAQEPLDLTSLLELGPSGLNVNLRSGQSKILRGKVQRLGRRIDIELLYNGSFGGGGIASWTRTMRPDYSLHIVPESPYGVEQGVWLHFDAKYRIERIEQVLGESVAEDNEYEEDATEESSRALPSDLLKMHAYRDAVRRSAGAFVLYPGTESSLFRQYHELLPGLGAFTLGPTEEGGVKGEPGLRTFLEDVLSHLATHTTQHERGRYWGVRSYERGPRTEQPARSAPFLTRPAADTTVLLGYVKSRAHLAWIRRTGLYNLRADKRAGRVSLGAPELSTALILLYGDSIDHVELYRAEGTVQFLERSDLLASGYPSPGGDSYFCLTVGSVDTYGWRDLIHPNDVKNLRRETAPSMGKGSPIVVTWHMIADRVGEMAGVGAPYH